MSSKYPVLPPNKIISIMQKLEFEKVSQKGSHAKYRNIYTNRTFIIPLHSEIAKGTLKSILEQADVKLEIFLSLI